MVKHCCISLYSVIHFVFSVIYFSPSFYMLYLLVRSVRYEIPKISHMNFLFCQGALRHWPVDKPSEISWLCMFLTMAGANWTISGSSSNCGRKTKLKTYSWLWLEMFGNVWIHSLFGVATSGGYAATSGAAEGPGHGPGAFVGLASGFECCGGCSDLGDAFRWVEEVVAVKASCWENVGLIFPMK